MVEGARPARRGSSDRAFGRRRCVVDEGTFNHPFTASSAGTLDPNGERVVVDLMNILRFDEEGRIVEEHVRTDNRSFLRQLGAEGA